ncbi:MAG: hypothetical protein ACP5P6_08690, partial [Candidatus Saccharicenans sp.]
QPENGGYEILIKKMEDKGIYKKLVLKEGICIGAIWLGTKKGVQDISQAIQLHKNIDSFKKDILEENFDFSQLNRI